MTLESATARIFLAACIFILPVFFLSHHVAAATSFSFDFSNPSKYSLGDLRFEGDAALNGDLVDLTCNSKTSDCSGRMSYDHPVAFYDIKTGEVASFSTTFTFTIKMWPSTSLKGDGMTFFLSGYPSSLPSGSYGGGLGLTNSAKTTPPAGADRYVAVEFDTWADAWDPTESYSHIGIDLNSLTSVSTTRLKSYDLTGTMTATITFDKDTRMLEATLTYGAGNSLGTPNSPATASVKTQLPDKLDALLPPVVAVGFSATTGINSELHQIHSWSFKSTLAATETPTGATAETPTGATKILPEQDGALDTKETTTGSNTKQGKTLGVKGRKNQALVKGGLATLASALLLATWSSLSSWKMKQKRQSFGKGSQVKRLEYKDLSTATCKFSDKNKIGAGSSGQVYKAVLRNKEVAVKKILQDSQGKFKDFLAELGTIGETGHKNVVKVEGWCCSISNFMTTADENSVPEPPISPDDAVALPYSSGTTGLPKGVVLTHGGLVSSVAQQVDGENPNLHMRAGEDVVLCVLPLFHIFSLNSVLLCALRAGAAVMLMPRFEMGAMLEGIERWRVTVAAVVPPLVLALAKNPGVEKHDLSSIRIVLSGAAPLGKELEDALRGRLPQAIFGQGYGMTEAGPVLSMCPAFAREPTPAKSGSCGTVVRNAQLKVVDPDTGVSLGRNLPGEICIRGPQIMKGYLNDPVATAATIDVEGWLHTGDIGYVDDDDEVFIVDRVKELIKFKGFQVPPAELEALLIAHPSIADAAVVPQKDDAAGEVPVAFVVRAADSDIAEEAIKEFVSKQVVFYKRLHKVYFTHAIPKSASGKILRKELRAKLAAPATA